MGQKGPTIDHHSRVLKRDIPLQLLIKIGPHLLDGSPQGGDDAGRQIADVAAGRDVLLDQPEKRGDSWIVMLGSGLWTVTRPSSIP
jgi:hypothetical protein